MLQMIQYNTTGETLVINTEKMICSNWLSHDELDAPLADYSLDNDLEPEDLAEGTYRVTRERQTWYELEARDSKGEWSVENAGNATVVYETYEMADDASEKLAICLECEPSEVRVAEIEVDVDLPYDSSKPVKLPSGWTVFRVIRG